MLRLGRCPAAVSAKLHDDDDPEDEAEAALGHFVPEEWHAGERASATTNQCQPVQDGSSSETNGGRQRGVKLAERSSVHRQEKRVLTTQSSCSGR
jgi:hypothetical protein